MRSKFSLTLVCLTFMFASPAFASGKRAATPAGRSAVESLLAALFGGATAAVFEVGLNPRITEALEGLSTKSKFAQAVQLEPRGTRVQPSDVSDLTWLGRLPTRNDR